MCLSAIRRPVYLRIPCCPTWWAPPATAEQLSCERRGKPRRNRRRAGCRLFCGSGRGAAPDRRSPSNSFPSSNGLSARNSRYQSPSKTMDAPAIGAVALWNGAAETLPPFRFGASSRTPVSCKSSTVLYLYNRSGVAPRVGTTSASKAQAPHHSSP